MICFRSLSALVLSWVLCASAWAAGGRELSAVALSDLQVLSVERIDGERPGELSGLAWDGAAQRLYAVSDRGRLFAFTLSVEADRITALTPRFGGLISGPAGAGKKVNAEALALRPGSTGLALLVADENTSEVLVVDTEGRRLAGEPMPPALRDPALRRGGNSGVEALGWHADRGLIAAPQRPLRDTPAGVHHLYAGGRVWAFKEHPGGRSSLKDLVVIDARHVLVLEKVAQPQGHLTVLREVDLDACPPTAPCDAPAAVLADARLQAGDNFEGLTCMDAERCLLVSDSGGSAPARTVFALVRLQRR